MSHDPLAAMLNDLTNCKKAGKSETIAIPVSKLMIEVLKILKKHGYINDFKIEEGKFKKAIIKIGKIHKCHAIKPRFYVNMKNIDRYVKRYLPARDIGIVIISTNKGLKTHEEAIREGVGGCLIAYCY